jgi:hypothetical protein
MLGSGNQADWRLIDIRDGSASITVRDMTLDGTQRKNTEEQTHLLHINGPASEIVAERIVFDFPSIGPSAGGDCVRLLGGAGIPVKGVVLRHLAGYRCDRSFVAFQRGVYNVLLDQVRSYEVGDQAIDFEPSGSVDLGDITIQNSRFARGQQSQGGYTVAIGGNGQFTAKRIKLLNTEILDGGLHVIDAEDVVVQNVNIQAKPNAGEPPIHMRKRLVGIRVINTKAVRPFSTVVGPVVAIHHQSGAAPTDVSLDGVVLEQHLAAPLISIESVAAFTMTNSQLLYNGPHGAFMAITGRGVIAALNHVELRDNTLTGAAQGLLRLGQFSPSFPTGQVIVTGNQAVDLTTYGVRFEGGLPTVPPIIANNNFGAADPVQP